MTRFLSGTRSRLVLTQVAVLTLALLVSDVGVYLLLSAAEMGAADDVLRSQAATISAGIENVNGSVSFSGGDLPAETRQGIAVEAAIVITAGSITQTAGQPLSSRRLQTLASSSKAGATWLTFTDTEGTPRRALAEPINLGTGAAPAVIIVSRSVKETQTTLARTALFLAVLSLGLIVVGALLAHRLAGRVLQPVRRIAAMARTLSQHDLHQRVDIAVPSDELGELVETFNGMLARLEGNFDSLRRFTADASHELRTPLTLMRTELEGTLAKPRSAEEYRRVMRELEAEVLGMSRVADHLLYLARADAGGLQPALAPVDVADFVFASESRWRKVARARTITIEVSAPDAGKVSADEDLLRRVVDNLLDNAIRLSPPGGRIDLSAAILNGSWRIEVHDQGPGVAPGLEHSLFDRFARSDSVRGRDDGGAGLGLALSRAIAEAHGGSLDLIASQGGGASFRLELPAESRATTAA